MNKDDIAKMILEGLNKNYSHVIICGDTWNFEYYPQYIKSNKNIESVIQKDRIKDIKIMEIYNYNLSLLEQLNEYRAIHKDNIINNNLYDIPNVFVTQTLRRAISKAILYHKNQYRKDGVTPYIKHPLRVVNIAANYFLNSNITTFEELKKIDNILITCVFHDVFEEMHIMPYTLIYEFPNVIDSIFELSNSKMEIEKIGKTK